MRLRRDLPQLIEVGLLGLFFVQAVRFLYGTLYAHLGSLDQLTRTLNPAQVGAQPGVIQLADLQLELLIAGGALLLPILALLFHRVPFLTLAAGVAAVGRVYMTFSGRSVLGVAGAAAVIGGAALYAAILARRRGSWFPVLFVLGFALDQVVRTAGFTADPTWDGQFLAYQAGLSMLLFVVAVINLWMSRREQQHPDYQPPPRTRVAGWGAVALGGLLYLQFAVLGLPHLIERRAGVDVPLVTAPFLVIATLLPLVPAVRELVRRFLVIFDAQWRGWVWLLLTGLLIVIGFRFAGFPSVVALLAAQFLICLSFWWLIQPVEGRINFSGPALTIGLLLFLALTGADYFTYDYAFVRGLQEPFATLLRSLRGLGIGVVLLALLLVNLPAIVARKRLPFAGVRVAASAIPVVLVIGAAGLTFQLTPVLFYQGVIGPPPQDLRVATLNLHGGFSLYFDEDLKSIAAEINKSGADVVLLQEVETGRMVSFGVDQAAWLAHETNRRVSYIPTNEAFQGLAVLSFYPIRPGNSQQLLSIGKQTGVQHVRIQYSLAGVLRGDSTGFLEIYNTYLSLPVRDSAAETQQEQQRQLDEILRLIATDDPNLSKPTVLGGTFNALPNSELYTKLTPYFIDSSERLLAENAITWRLINNERSRVDYVWLKNVEALEAGVTEVLASTHNMPVVKFGLK